MAREKLIDRKGTKEESTTDGKENEVPAQSGIATKWKHNSKWSFAFIVYGKLIIFMWNYVVRRHVTWNCGKWYCMCIVLLLLFFFFVLFPAYVPPALIASGVLCPFHSIHWTTVHITKPPSLHTHKHIQTHRIWWHSFFFLPSTFVVGAFIRFQYAFCLELSQWSLQRQQFYFGLKIGLQ